MVATKATGPSAQMLWIRGGPTSLSAKDILEALDGSLERLQTDYIDIYQLHWPDRYTLLTNASLLHTKKCTSACKRGFSIMSLLALASL